MTELPIAFLLVVSILAGWFGGIARNQYSKRYANRDVDVYLFLLICQVTALVVLIATSTEWELSWFTLLTALFFWIDFYCAWANGKQGSANRADEFVQCFDGILYADSGCIWCFVLEGIPIGSYDMRYGRYGGYDHSHHKTSEEW